MRDYYNERIEVLEQSKEEVIHRFEMRPPRPEEASQIEKEIEEKKNQLNLKNQDLSKIKNQYESEKKNINDAIEHFKSSSSNSNNKTESDKNRELISIIQTQIENLIQSEENNVKYSSLLKQQNQLKRSAKETLENEVNQLKKQLKNVNKSNSNFDPENPQLIVNPELQNLIEKKSAEISKWKTALGRNDPKDGSSAL